MIANSYPTQRRQTRTLETSAYQGHTNLERKQYRATKFIPNNYDLSYRQRLEHAVSFVTTNVYLQTE